MHRIRVFLASSITEFPQERMLLGDFVRTLNDILVERDVYIHLEKSEDITNAIDLYRKQNQYNAVIQKSDFFFMLIGKAVGAYTMEEYETACGSEKKGMRILFCGGKPAEGDLTKLPDGLPDAGAAMTPEQFRERLEDEKRTYMDCASTDSMKLALLMMLTAEKEIAQGLLFRDGQAWLDGRQALSLMETPVYQSEEGLRQMVLRKQDLERMYVQCLQAGDSESLQKAELLKEEIAELSGKLSQQENSLLDMFAYINQNNAGGDRERTAQRYLAQGDLPAAIEILRDPLRQSEREAAEEGIRRLREQVRTQIRLNMEEAFELLGGEIPDSLPEKPEYAYLVDMLLKENSELAQEYLIELPVIGEYGRWLMLRGDWSRAAAMIRKMETYIDLYGTEEKTGGKKDD